MASGTPHCPRSIVFPGRPLALPEGKVLRQARTAATGSGLACFNPHLARGQGATPRLRAGDQGDIRWFQSSPCPRARCYRSAGEARLACECCFNPHLARGQGATQHAGVLTVRHPRFQSSPCPRARCYRPGRIATSQRVSRFNPHLARGQGATYTEWRCSAVLLEFQSSPCPRARCYRRCGRRCGEKAQVSILTLPEGKVLHRLASDGCRWWFQSSPCPRARCYAARNWHMPMSPRRFNPHLARGQGATSVNFTWCDGLSHVSILTLPEGKVLLGRSQDPGERFHRFNPHLARGQGATFLIERKQGRVDHVSILTLPEGKVLQAWFVDSRGRQLFQSSPCPRARCYSDPHPSNGVADHRFNPHLARGQGATSAPSRLISPPSQFQSSPCPRARCYMASSTAHLPGHCLFQSSPCPRARCYAAAASLRVAVDGVSILTLPEGKVLRRRSTMTPSLLAAFQSSPCPRARCYPRSDHKIEGAMKFQSSPCPRARCYAALRIAQMVACTRFNPHLARGQGATHWPQMRVRRTASSFNPHLARGQGATARAWRQGAGERGFNPHLARGQGATRVEGH